LEEERERTSGKINEGRKKKRRRPERACEAVLLRVAFRHAAGMRLDWPIKARGSDMHEDALLFGGSEN